MADYNVFFLSRSPENECRIVKINLYVASHLKNIQLLFVVVIMTCPFMYLQASFLSSDLGTITDAVKKSGKVRIRQIRGPVERREIHFILQILFRRFMLMRIAICCLSLALSYYPNILLSTSVSIYLSLYFHSISQSISHSISHCTPCQTIEVLTEAEGTRVQIRDPSEYQVLLQFFILLPGWRFFYPLHMSCFRTL